MNSYIDREQFDNKSEVFLPITEVKTEPVSIQHKIKSEAEECVDFLKHEIQLSPDYVTYVKTSEVQCADQENSIVENETNIPATECINYKVDIVEEKCNMHVSNITRDRNYKCRMCKNTLFENNYTAINVKTAGRDLLCNLCKSSKPFHDKIFICDFCSKSFAEKVYLVKHMRIHTGEKPYCCNFCGKLFSDKSNLKVHTRTHTGERLFKCDLCSKSFNLKSTLVTHRITHTGEKPFTCNVCNMSFTQKSSLTAHSSIHSDQNLFSCTFCSESFSRKSRLIKHTRLHTAEKPYTCDICKKSFFLKHDILIHMRLHITGKLFTCDICSKSFSSKKSVNRHMQIHTNYV